MGDVRVVLSGIPKRQKYPHVVSLQLTGEYLQDVELARTGKETFSGKTANVDAAFSLVLDTVGCGKDSGKAPAAVFRVANNTHTPAETLKHTRGCSSQMFPYSTIDCRGHLFDTFEGLPDLEQVVCIP